MIALNKLAERIQTKLNQNQEMYDFYIVSDTAKFKRPSRDKNTITEYVNCLLTANSSDVSTLSNNYLFSTLTCTLNIIMRLKGYDDDVYTQDETPQLITYGDKSRVAIMRQYLDNVFQGNEVYSESDNDGKNYIVSVVYEFAQSGTRAQVEKIGDSYTFMATIFYSFVQNGMNTKDVVFNLDGVVIPYQSITMYRTPTMDGNVYANTTDGATKNLMSQTTWSVAFELPALSNDKTTQNLLNYLFKGDMNQVHLLKMQVGTETIEKLVMYSEHKVMGEIVKNVGQSITFVEAPNEYDLISFGEYLYVYACVEATEYGIGPNPDELTPVIYMFGPSGNNDFIKYVEDDTLPKGAYIVSTVKLVAGPDPSRLVMV